MRKKNRKLRRLRELYPDIRIKLFYARDFRAMMLKYGRLGLAESLSGTSGQVVPGRGPARRVASPARRPPMRRRHRPRSPRHRSSGQLGAGRARPPGATRKARRRSAGIASEAGASGRPAMRSVVDQGADIGEVLLTEDQIQTRVAELGAPVSADLRRPRS